MLGDGLAGHRSRRRWSRHWGIEQLDRLGPRMRLYSAWGAWSDGRPRVHMRLELVKVPEYA